MWNKPTEKRLAKIPTDTHEVSLRNKIVHLHFFLGGNDWYAIEYIPEKRLFFGYVIINGDIENSEFGYFSFDELIGIKMSGMEVDCELAKYWKPTKITEIQKIKHLVEGY